MSKHKLIGREFTDKHGRRALVLDARRNEHDLLVVKAAVRSAGGGQERHHYEALIGTFASRWSAVSE